jgi:Tfp pilus assembly protein PilN
MNAVNLIPGDSRSRRTNVSTSPQTIALCAGLVAALVAAVLYVFAANDVTTRTSELAQVTATANRWQAAANAYTSYTAEASQRAEQMDAVRQLASSRFEWSQLLDQISGLMPGDAALTSLSASTADAAATGTTTPTSAATTTGATVPTVTLAGCASTQSEVALAMVQLHRVHDVSAVTLSSSVDSGSASTGAASSSSAASAGSGACPFPVQFQVALTFTAPSAAGASGATSSTAGASPTAAPAASAATTTPVTATGTTTGAAQ